MKFAGKVALVTGGSRGIGAAIAKRLASEGAQVAVNYVSRGAAAEGVVAEIGATGGQAVALQGDVSQETTATDLVEKTVAAFGRLDLLVNNAGIAVHGRVADIPAEQWIGGIATNLFGTFYMSKAALSELRKNRGVILNISSINSQICDPTLSSYSASKAAIEAFTKSLGKEEAASGVRVVCIAPGPTRTEMQVGGWSDERIQRLEQMIPLQRIGDPDEIARAASFLLSDEASYITAITLTVSGGLAGHR